MIKAFTLATACFIGLSFIANQEITTIALGTACPMPDAKMKNIDGKELSLNDSKGDNGLLVIFSCNTCPFVVGDGEKSEGWEGRYNGVYEKALQQKVNTVLVNSNFAKRDKGDSFEDMVKHAADKGYKMPYLLDNESALANAFGARTTPHVFLFDKNMKLVYRGSIDDNVSSANAVKEKYLEKALTSLGSGKKIKKNDTKAIGCSIKRKVN